MKKGRGWIREYFHFLGAHPFWWLTAVLLAAGVIVAIVFSVGDASDIPMLYKMY